MERFLEHTQVLKTRHYLFADLQELQVGREEWHDAKPPLNFNPLLDCEFNPFCTHELSPLNISTQTKPVCKARQCWCKPFYDQKSHSEVKLGGSTHNTLLSRQFQLTLALYYGEGTLVFHLQILTMTFPLCCVLRVWCCPLIPPSLLLFPPPHPHNVHSRLSKLRPLPTRLHLPTKPHPHNVHSRLSKLRPLPTRLHPPTKPRPHKLFPPIRGVCFATTD